MSQASQAVARQSKKLKQLESRIEVNIKKAWYENGLIMLQIKEEKLYQKDYATFEDYLEKKWEISRSRGHRLIDSARFMAQITDENVAQKTEMGNISEADLPKSERQIRPLIALENTGEKLHVWKTVVEEAKEADVKITAELVQKKVDDFKASGLVIDDVEIEVSNISMDSGSFHVIESIAVKNQTSPIALFSIEMPAEIMAIRMIASLGRIELSRMLSGKLQDEDWARLTSAINVLASSKLFIDDSSYLPMQTYSARLSKLAAEHGKIAFVGVDYLQLMDAPEHKNNMVQKIGAISRGLKMSAKMHKCPVVALSQLSRNVESRTDKRPMMSDLRESGQIEQDADLIMFVYRDEVYNEDSTDKGTAEFIIAKSRNGEIGTVRVTSNLSYARFENFAGVNYENN